jgi:hypothetical protein
MENKLFKKLNYKQQESILALNYPGSFEGELESMEMHATVHRDLGNAGEVLDFVIAFGKTLEEVNELTRSVGPRLSQDAVFWFCYPKKSSKKYSCEFNRDTGWGVMAEFDLEPVRQVAIDEDWSAIRFRNVDQIAKMTRRESFALTRKGKERSRRKGT